LQVAGEERTFLKFHPRLAPIKAAVLPLVKNKPELLAKARAIHDRLQRRYYVEFDTAGAIGRRYRRNDEVRALVTSPRGMVSSFSAPSCILLDCVDATTHSSGGLDTMGTAGPRYR
jgi:hypothetical protein